LSRGRAPPTLIQISRIGDEEEAERMLDALETATGRFGERTSIGRRYDFTGSETVGQAADELAATLGRVAPGWQDHLVLEL
jgi:hypothetical protein